MSTIDEGQCDQLAVRDPQDDGENTAIGVKKKIGRPRKLEPNDFTLGGIQRLAQLGCTVEDIARALGVDKKTFIKFKADYPQVREARERGRSIGRVSLRRNLVKLAETNARVAILLAVNHLGMHNRCCPQLRKAPQRSQRGRVPLNAEGKREFTITIFDEHIERMRRRAEQKARMDSDFLHQNSDGEK